MLNAELIEGVLHFPTQQNIPSFWEADHCGNTHAIGFV